MRVDMIGISSDRLLRCGAHSHGQWEIVVFLKGSGVLHVGELDVAFEPGTIVCQPPEVPHGETGFSEYQDMWLRVDEFVPPDGCAVPVYHDDEEKRFTTLCRMIYESFFKREPNSRRIVDALGEALSQLMVGWSAGRIENPMVDQLVHDMVLNISNHDFDIAAHMEKSGYCSDHFRRCFKREMGTTPTAYMISLRIDHACRLLDQPDRGGYTIKQIASLSGFSDPYYFSSLFKKVVGRSPTAYQREKKNGE